MLETSKCKDIKCKEKIQQRKETYKQAGQFEDAQKFLQDLPRQGLAKYSRPIAAAWIDLNVVPNGEDFGASWRASINDIVLSSTSRSILIIMYTINKLI